MLALHDQRDQEKMKKSHFCITWGTVWLRYALWMRRLKWRASVFSGLSFLFAGLLAVALGTVGIGIVNLLLMSVTERLSEYQTMRAIGAGRPQVFGWLWEKGL